MDFITNNIAMIVIGIIIWVGFLHLRGSISKDKLDRVVTDLKAVSSNLNSLKEDLSTFKEGVSKALDQRVVQQENILEFIYNSNEKSASKLNDLKSKVSDIEDEIKDDIRRHEELLRSKQDVDPYLEALADWESDRDIHKGLAPPPNPEDFK